MIRTTDDQRAVGIGIDRRTLARLLLGERVCIPAGQGAPHVCLFYADTDDALLERTKQLYPDGLLPGAVVEDHRR